MCIDILLPDSRQRRSAGNAHARQYVESLEVATTCWSEAMQPIIHLLDER